jgi:hypothetical protein
MTLEYQLDAQAHGFPHVLFNCLEQNVTVHSVNRQPEPERVQKVKAQLDKQDLCFLHVHAMIGIVHGVGPTEGLKMKSFVHNGMDYEILDASQPVSILAGSNRQAACRQHVQENPNAHPLWKIFLFRECEYPAISYQTYLSNDPQPFLSLLFSSCVCKIM